LPRLALWCRCKDEDIAFAAGLKPDVLSLSLPVSDRHLEKRLGKDRAWALARLGEAAALAKSLGLTRLSLGLEDAGRADAEFMRQIIAAARAAGIGRIRFADTVGMMSPAETGRLITEARRDFPELEFAFHAHNDFGLATANALAALEAGAQWADVAVLGLGERAGCARLEELAGLLTLCREKKNYRIGEIASLCTLVANAAGRPIAANHPLVGSAIFTAESGLHVHGLLQDPAAYEPFPPEKVKAGRRLLLGAKSGAGAVLCMLAAMGLPQKSAALPGLLRRIREKAGEMGRPLGELDVRALL